MATNPTFNTAVFFDVENVLGGYDTDAIANVSISQIMNVIREEGANAGLLSSIAVNRAYANWSIARLSVLRREIVEQGIEPKQIFGFDRGEKKNAADIELVIDAIDLAYTRQPLTTFVIVSGDGGFSSLVKKLHELGKSVVVCAYSDRISPALRAVCDLYIDLSATAVGNREGGDRADGRPSEISDSRVRDAVEGLEPLRDDADIAAISERAVDVVRRIATAETLVSHLRDAGLTLALVGQGLAQQLPSARGRFGFNSPKALLQYALSGSEFALAVNPEQQPPHPRVVLRDAVPPGLTLLPDIDARHVYKTELERDLPRYFVPEPAQLHQLVDALVQEPPLGESLAQLIERMSERLQPALSTEHVKFTLGAFVGAGAFERAPPNERLINQTLTLKASLRDEARLIEVLRRAVEAKLRRVFGRVDEATLNAMFTGDARSTTSDG